MVVLRHKKFSINCVKYKSNQIQNVIKEAVGFKEICQIFSETVNCV